MQDPYKETVRQSPNVGGKIAPKFIILHHTSGNYVGSVSWCLNPKSKVSYHYIIDPRDGSRTQLVWDTRRAWHAGKSQWAGLSNLNSHSIGIAFDRDTNTRTPSPAEIDSCAHKCLYLMEKFGIKADGILTHAMISPGRKNDTSAETHRLVKERIAELTK
jgi:N-acetylmuramoyl-L-alanine amidase